MDDFLNFGDNIDFSSVNPADLGAPQDAFTLGGDNNSPPLQTDLTYQSASSTLQKLGSIDYSKLATSVGTAVGTIEKEIKQIGPNYNAAQQAASSTNPLSGLATWWQYASTTDKLMVGLAVLGIVVALNHKG